VLVELMEKHVALKKVLGRFEGPMGAARQAPPGDRLRSPLERADGDRLPEVHPLAGSGIEQVLRLASPPGRLTARLWAGPGHTGGRPKTRSWNRKTAPAAPR